ncbi:MAG: hypothetical protein ISS76_21340 [Phycisphaerae bacterium]|nr:hypothetical protein [Phycisphaerae bacterium]
MKRDKAKQKAKAAIETIIQAAKELAAAEQAYYSRQPKEPIKRQTIMGGQRRG